MSVIVQRHGDIGMSHDVLQVFGVHPSVGKASAEGMPHGMGRDVRQGLIRLVVLVVLPDKPLEHTLVTGRRFGKAALVEEQEVGVAPDIDRGGLASVLHSPLQCLVDLLAHGDLPRTLFGLWLVHIVAELAVPQKLVVHMDAAVFKIQVRCQSAQLGNAEAGPQQNDDLITILPVDRIVAGEGQEAVLLLLGQRGFFLRVILQDIGYGEVERVFADAVILNRRVEGRLQIPFPVAYGLVGVALLAHPEATTTEITTTKEVTTSETTVEVDENGYPILEPLDSELEQEIINAYIDTLPDKVKNDPDFCGESVYIYYGTYDGYPVVAMNYHGAISSSLISQGVLDYWFDFPGEFLIQAYSDGKFEDISLIADNNEDAIAAMHYYHTQAMDNRNSEDDSASYPELEPLSDDAVQTLITDYTEYLPDEVTSGIDFEYSFVSRYLGTYNGYEVVIIDYSMSIHSDAEGTIWVGDFDFFIPYLGRRGWQVI